MDLAALATLVSLVMAAAALVISLLSWRATHRQAAVMLRDEHRAMTPLVEVTAERHDLRNRYSLLLVNRDARDLDSCRIELLNPPAGGAAGAPGFEVSAGEQLHASVDVKGGLASAVPVTVFPLLLVRADDVDRTASFRLLVTRAEASWAVVVSARLPGAPRITRLR